MYVGQSIDIDRRYRQHIGPMRSYHEAKKYAWIKSLAAEKMLPKLVVLAYCDWPETDEIERRLIQEHKARGECELNQAIGGSGAAVSRTLNSSEDDWFQLGLKIKKVRLLLMEIADDTARLSGHKTAKPLENLIYKLDSIKSKLESRLVKAFPSWTRASRVFYGPTEDDG